MSGTDILERLGATACNREPFTPEHAECQCRLASAAAKEIETLRAALQEARDIITCLVENDPNDYAADAVTVLQVWRKDAVDFISASKQ